MKILGIESSCDETSVCVVDISEREDFYKFNLDSHHLYSQIRIYKEYGGVVPDIAKREHSEKLVPLTKLVLDDLNVDVNDIPQQINDNVSFSLANNQTLFNSIQDIIEYKKPNIDMIAVTSGPGLEPALWTGLNFAKALSLLWDIPLYPVNHMEGHLFSPFILEDKIIKPTCPFLSLLVSGGHTELVLAKEINEYEKLGETRDDAAGEAFDKTARLLGLPYPGGALLSELADKSRKANRSYSWKFPRPMIKDDNFDFSFSGLKTSVKYAVTGKKLTDEDKEDIAQEFENSIIEVLITKMAKAIDVYGIKEISVGGGVSANSHLQNELKRLAEEKDLNLSIPLKEYTGDNAVMIAVSAYLKKLPCVLISKFCEVKANSSLSI